MKWREKRLKKDFYFDDYEMDFLKDGVILLFTSAGILLFFNIQFEAQKLKDTFDRMPAADGYVRLDLLIAAGTCQHKVNGRDSLTAHQSFGKIPKMLHIK